MLAILFVAPNEQAVRPASRCRGFTPSITGGRFFGGESRLAAPWEHACNKLRRQPVLSVRRDFPPKAVHIGLRSAGHREVATAMKTGLLAIGCLWAAVAMAQEAAPAGVDAAAFAAKRFPQPVRVGDLLQRTVLEPVESRRILGHVDSVIRIEGGREAIVMTFGGFLGLGAHRIAVPLEAMVLLGSELEVLDFTPQQLEHFPTYNGTGTVLGVDEIIHMGLAHPSH